MGIAVGSDGVSPACPQRHWLLPKSPWAHSPAQATRSLNAPCLAVGETSQAASSFRHHCSFADCLSRAQPRAQPVLHARRALHCGSSQVLPEKFPTTSTQLHPGPAGGPGAPSLSRERTVHARLPYAPDVAVLDSWQPDCSSMQLAPMERQKRQVVSEGPTWVTDGQGLSTCAPLLPACRL